MDLLPDDSHLIRDIRRFFPKEIQEDAIVNLKLRLESAYLRGQLSALNARHNPAKMEIGTGLRTF